MKKVFYPFFIIIFVNFLWTVNCSGQNPIKVATAVSPAELVEKIKQLNSEISVVKMIKDVENLYKGGRVISFRLLEQNNMLYFNFLVFIKRNNILQLCSVNLHNGKISQLGTLQIYPLGLPPYQYRTVSSKDLSKILEKAPISTYEVVNKISQDKVQVIASRLATMRSENDFVYEIILLDESVPSIRIEYIEANTGRIVKVSNLSTYPLQVYYK